MQQYLRKVRATLSGSAGTLVVNPGGIQKHEIKIQFDVSKGIESSQNTAEISIWNLTEGHRNAVGKELDDITLEAGYMPPDGSSNVGIIFKGQMRDVEHRREGPDIITTLSCGDGDRAFRRATISKTFPKGTAVEDVVEELYKQMEKEGVSRGEWKFPDDIQEKKFKRPYSMCGSCVRELDTLGRGKGFYWSSQNGVMEIVPANGYVGGIVLISPETGMIDTPTLTDNGVKVSALLNPEIRPNRRVRIESETLEMNAEGGEYRVSQCAFVGDNREGDFTVIVHGEAIKGGNVDEGKKK